MEFIEFEKLEVDPLAIALLPMELAFAYRVCPIIIENGVLFLACEAIPSQEQQITLSNQLSYPLDWKLVTPLALHDALQIYYQSDLSDTQSYVLQEPKTVFQNNRSLPTALTEAPAVQYFKELIQLAISKHASDIHLEPFKHYLRIRLRIDGSLVVHEEIPWEQFQDSLITRLKLLARMQVDEQRLPQDGRIWIQLEHKRYDLRLACIPSLHGESITIRILEASKIPECFSDLGMLSSQSQQFQNVLRLSHGLILVCGPTGSGKSTTLYSSLNYLNNKNRKIITLEDPVEYIIPGINQVSLFKQDSERFHQALKSILRQAPDVIMIGEIRDKETAAIAITASLTGHLVLSSLHTQDAPSAFQRLIDLGIEPYLVYAALQCIIAQALIKTVCPHCAEKEPLSKDLRAYWSLSDSLTHVVKGRGCHSCNQSGYQGRTGLFELLRVDDQLRAQLTTEPVRDSLYATLTKQCILDHAKHKLARQETTPEELLALLTPEYSF